MVRPGALVLDDLLCDVKVPASVLPDLSGNIDGNIPDKSEKDIFAENTRKGWAHEVEPRCDFSPNKVKISFRNPEFGIISLWNRSVYGRTLSEIKADDEMIPFFVKGLSKLIAKILGADLSKGDWALVTSPKRRHKERNFASLVAKGLAKNLNINFYEDLAGCKNRQRVNASFFLQGKPPSEHNIIVFDDFVTSGSTMIAMRNLLLPMGYNLIFFTGINNKA